MLLFHDEVRCEVALACVAKQPADACDRVHQAMAVADQIVFEKGCRAAARKLPYSQARLFKVGSHEIGLGILYRGWDGVSLVVLREDLGEGTFLEGAHCRRPALYLFAGLK